jgi:hypothetical protein
MESEKKERDILPLTFEELELVVKALEEYYQRVLRKTKRLTKNCGVDKGRSIKDTQVLAKVQECLQYVTLVRNIHAGKLNPDVAESGGLTVEKETTNNTGESELPGNQGETGSLS